MSHQDTAPSFFLEKGKIICAIMGKQVKVDNYGEFGTTKYLLKAELLKVGVPEYEIAKVTEPTKTGPSPLEEFYEANHLELVGLDREGNPVEDLGKFADYALSKRPYACLVKGEELLYYNDGVWRSGGETRVKADLVAVLGKAKRSLLLDVIANVNARCYKEWQQFNRHPTLLNLANGIFNLETWRLEKHSQDYYLTVKLPTEYKEDAIPREFLRFIREILPDIDDRFMVLEELAYCLWRTMPIHKAFMWVGTGRNGKSTLIAVMDALLGPENVSHASIHEIIGDRFAAADVVDRLANMGTDISSKEISNTGLIKRLTGNDGIRVQRKHRDAFDAYSTCKMFFCANQLPEVEDNTDAWMSRWEITEFKQQFLGEKADKKLIKRLTTPEELSGVLNLLLRILKGFMVREGFKSNATIQETRAVWGEKADIVQNFIMQELVQGLNARETKKAVYDAYAEFCDKRKFTQKGMVAFGQALKEKVKGLGEQGAHLGGHGSPVAKFWTGIKLKSTKLEQLEPPGPEEKGDTPPNGNAPKDPEPILETGETQWVCECGWGPSGSGIAKEHILVTKGESGHKLSMKS